MLLGVIMLFDGPLIALGNVESSPPPLYYRKHTLTESNTIPSYSRAQILFVSGLPLIIGPRKTFYFFARRNKLRGCEPVVSSFSGHRSTSRRDGRADLCDLTTLVRSRLVHRRHRARVPQIPLFRSHHRDVWLPEPLWVRAIFSSLSRLGCIARPGLTRTTSSIRCIWLPKTPTATFSRSCSPSCDNCP
jgi:hypothetical protein